MIIALGSFLITSIMKIIAAKSAAQGAIMKAALNNYKEERAERSELNSLDSKWSFSFTRRTIALLIVGSVVAVPILAPIFSPVAVSYCTPTGSETSGLWGLLSWNVETLSCKLTQGITIMPWHGQLVAVVTGAYFGGRVTR